jgi:hypothetical protein
MRTSRTAAVGFCLLVPLACSDRAGLKGGNDAHIGRDGASPDAPGRTPQSTPSDGQVALDVASVTVALDASTFSPTGPQHPDARPATPAHDGPVEQRIGGMGNLNDGGACSLDRLWLFIEEGSSSYCGDLGDACQFICGTRSGCWVEAEINEPQFTYCPGTAHH